MRIDRGRSGHAESHVRDWAPSPASSPGAARNYVTAERPPGDPRPALCAQAPGVKRARETVRDAAGRVAQCVAAAATAPAAATATGASPARGDPGLALARYLAGFWATPLT